MSCEDDVEPAQEAPYTIAGTVSLHGQPASGVTVILDASAQIVESNSDGSFVIQNVEGGDHLVRFSALEVTAEFGAENPLVSEKAVTVAVAGDTELGNIVLPAPSILYTPVEVSHKSITLQWSASNSDDFRTYSVYRYSSAEVTSANATLIYKSVDKNDTTFVDKYLVRETQYYYKVFSAVGSGEVTASNLVSVRTGALQVIQNGSFEDVADAIPVHWTLNYSGAATIALDNTRASDGTRSLKFTNSEHSICLDIYIHQKLDVTLLQANDSYRVTFDYLSDFSAGGEVLVTCHRSNYWTSANFSASGQWQTFEREITLVPTYSSLPVDDFRIHICALSNGTVWIDNVRLQKL